MNHFWKIALLLLLPTVLCSQAALAAEPYEVAAYYFPNYHLAPQNEARYGKGWNEWALVRAARPRFPGHLQPHVPAWGYEDESDPKVMAKKIDAAADHGVTAFIFDWYWYNNKPFLEKCLNDGFLKAPNRQRLKFALMWADHNWEESSRSNWASSVRTIYPGAVSREVFEHLTDHVIHDYFLQPNYWKIDGKPYFSLIDTTLSSKGWAGYKQAREALDHFRAKVRKAGLPGLHLNVCFGEKLSPDLVKALGFDSATSYCWGYHLEMAQTPATPYPAYAERIGRSLGETEKAVARALLSERQHGLGFQPAVHAIRSLEQSGLPVQQRPGGQHARGVQEIASAGQGVFGRRSERPPHLYHQRLERMDRKQLP